MGATAPDYHSDLYTSLRTKLGKKHWNRVSFKSTYYQDILQGQQVDVLDRMRDQIDWIALRKFLLFGFSDAASLEYRKEADDSAYYQTQMRILNALDSIYADAEDQTIPVVMVAQSLGCQVLSSYIWDAQRPKPGSSGIWSKPLNDGVAPGSSQDLFRRLRSLVHMCTTGCNIPIFVAGHKKIEAIHRPNDQFTWQNFFDKDDSLGWPLAPLSQSYWELVTDVSINAGGSLLSKITKSWNPLSHGEYWSDSQVIDHLATTLKSLTQ
jgi:hypothetical protein